jgi:hypothetical protein
MEAGFDDPEIERIESQVAVCLHPIAPDNGLAPLLREAPSGGQRAWKVRALTAQRLAVGYFD